MSYFAALLCQNCSRPIPLPHAKHPCTSPHQPSWPKDCAPRNFLCRACKHVYEYSVQDVRQIPFGETVQGPNRKSQNVVCVAIPCGEKGCAAQVQIHTLMASDIDLYAETPEVLALSHAHALRCDRGDILSGPIRPSGTNFSVQVDEDWETLED